MTLRDAIASRLAPTVLSRDSFCVGAGLSAMQAVRSGWMTSGVSSPAGLRCGVGYYRASRGIPKARSAMMLRCISLLPP